MLIAVTLFIFKKGDLFEKINVGLISATTLVTIILIILNGVTIKFIVKAYNPDKEIQLGLTVLIAAISTLGNSLGGLPIGTSIKFIILNRFMGVKVIEITFGLVVFAFGITTFYALYIFTVLPFVNIELISKLSLLFYIIIALTLVGAIIIIFVKKSIGNVFFSTFKKYKYQFIILCLLLSIGFIINYLIVGHFYIPQINSEKIIFTASLGSLISTLTFSQGLGGFQELSVGLSSLLTEISFINGVEVAFVLRIAALIGSSIVLCFLLPPYFQKLVKKNNIKI